MVNQINGSTVLYEMSAAVRESLTNNKRVEEAENISSPYGIDVKKYSPTNKLILTTAWISIFISNLKSDMRKKDSLSND